MEYAGKNIVITGASSGIGLLLLKELAKMPGTKIIGSARKTESINGLGLNNVEGIECDVSKPEQIDTLLETSFSKLGGIDFFFANAGFGYYGDIGEPNYGKIENIFRTNTLAPIYTLQKLTQMQNGKRFQYIITDSVLAKIVIPGFALYCATKFALDGFMQAYKFEQPKNVILSGVYPVAIKTKFFTKAASDTPIPFPAQTPEQVVAAIIKDVRKEKRHIYPLRGFGFVLWLMNFLPFIKSVYLHSEDKKFQEWLTRQK